MSSSIAIMYKKSKDRESKRIVFKTDQYEGALYKRSPYYVGCKLWDGLPISDIELPDIFSFKQCLKCKNRVNVNLL